MMRVSIERLRIALLAGAVLLVLVTAAFLSYGKLRARRFVAELPKKLGVDIKQETNAYTYSQSVQGHTVFTLHAAKAFQHNDGKYTLHDVGIVLYGKPGSQPNRVDRIYGKEFNYDPAAGVIKAVGEVHLDLQAPAPADAKGKTDYAAGKDLKAGSEPKHSEPTHSEPNHDDADKNHSDADKDEKLIHVKTYGLVFMRQLGVAATDQDVEFEFNGMTGHARGAEYNSDSGLLVLESAVKMNGLEQGKPAVLTAAHAELNRLSHTAVLTQAKYVTVGGATQQTAAAQHAVVYTRQDGSVERLEAQGEVTVTNGGDVRAVSDRAEVMLNPQSKPQAARMFGGVKYFEDSALRQGRGESQEAHATFDGDGRLRNVLLTGPVSMHERVNVASQQVSGAKPLWSERQLNAATVELALAPNSANKPVLQQAKASGDAKLHVVDPARPDAKPGSSATQSTMTGDVLTAHFVTSQRAQHLNEVDGDGHTTLKQVNEAGAEDDSSGDSLVVKFREAQRGVTPQKATSAPAGVQGGDQIASAVQQGNVVLTRRTVATAQTAADVQRGTAQHAFFDGDTQKITLTGGIMLTQTGGTVWADHATMDRVTGDATVEGGVKASYQQNPQSEVAHVLAQRGEMKKAAGQSVFYGTPGKPARLWQGGSQVEAPVLEIGQKQKTLFAHGGGQGGAFPVHTVLVSSGSNAADKPAQQPGQQTSGQQPSGPRVLRVSSRELNYSDEKREADFTGGVLVESADGKMRGQQAVAYLQSSDAQKTNANKSPTANAPQAGLFGGSVERVVVTGQIRMEQPGRTATGERLVYTASDGFFVLTGTATVLPKVVDETRGTVTGTELRFHTGDESVVISNGTDKNDGQRVHMETRVKK
jgi:lipopolysaccharide export system protein LptA